MAVAGTLTYETKLDTKEMETGFSKLGGIAKAGMATVASAVAGVSVAFGKLVKDSVMARGELEQQIGGVNKLFNTELGDASHTVIENANKAYKTAGLSAVEYMNTVTGFSASLISSLGGDTAEAARIADIAIRDMSDNANTFGTDMGSIQYAYQGFAKQNYTINLMSV